MKGNADEDEWVPPAGGCQTSAAPPSQQVLRSRTRALALVPVLQPTDTVEISPVHQAEDKVPPSSNGSVISMDPSVSPVTSSSATTTTTTTTAAAPLSNSGVRTVTRRRPREIWVTKAKRPVT